VSAFEVLALNTSIPQIQAAQAGDSYVMVVNATTPALRITQTGTGNAISVEDEANPDATPFVVTSIGDVGLGTSTPTQKLDVRGSIYVERNTNPTNGLVAALTNQTTSSNNGCKLSFDVYNIGSSAVGVPTDNAGLAFYTNGVTSEKMRLDASGNLGLGVTPSAWGSGIKAMQIGTSASFSGGSGFNDAFVASNAYYDGSNWKYINTNPAYYASVGGSDAARWYTAPSGTAGDAITFTQAMTLDASGNLGVGETSPTSRLHVAFTSNSVDATLRVQQKGNNTAAGITLSANDNNGAGYNFIQSETTGGTSHWKISGGVATSTMAFSTGGTERARITSGGYFKASNNGTYAGSTGSYHELYQTANNNGLQVTCSATTGTLYGPLVYFSGQAPNDATSYFLQCSDTGGERATIRSNGGLANYQSNNVDLSDARTKTDINPLGSYWSKIAGLEIVSYKYKDQTHDDLNIGVIAQQVEAVAPEFVDSDGFGDTPEDGVPLKTIYNKDLTFAAIKALQEAMARIETLEAKIAALEAK